MFRLSQNSLRKVWVLRILHIFTVKYLIVGIDRYVCANSADRDQTPSNVIRAFDDVKKPFLFSDLVAKS